MSTGPEFVVADFQLEEWELISGEPVFLLPRDASGFVCPIDSAALIEAYTYQHARVDPDQMLPCPVELWDVAALCLYEGKLSNATVALGKTGEVFLMDGVGYFSRNPMADLKWELTVEVKQ